MRPRTSSQSVRRAGDRRGPVGVVGLERRGRRLLGGDRADVRRVDRRRRAPRRRPWSAWCASRSRRGRPSAPVLLPGRTMSRLLPSWLICALTSFCVPSPRPTVRITAAMPMRMPSTVRIERSACDVHGRPAGAQGLGPGHRGTAVRRRSERRRAPGRPARARCGDVGLVRDEDDRAALRVQLVEQRRARPASTSSRGCPSARRRGAGPARRRGRGRPRRAAAGRRTARRAGCRAGRRGRPARARPPPARVRSAPWAPGRRPAAARRCASADSDGSRLNCWNTKPIRRLRMSARSISSSSPTSSPARRYEPRLSVSRQPRMFISVDLPEPDGPMTATYSPGSIRRSTPRSASNSMLPDV